MQWNCIFSAHARRKIWGQGQYKWSWLWLSASCTVSGHLSECVWTKASCLILSSSSIYHPCQCHEISEVLIAPHVVVFGFGPFLLFGSDVRRSIPLPGIVVNELILSPITYGVLSFTKLRKSLLFAQLQWNYGWIFNSFVKASSQ